MILKMKSVTVFIKLFSLAILIVFSTPVLAEDLVIRPFLIDELTEARGMVEKEVTLTNNYTHRKLVVFATVNEITVDSQGEIKEFVSPIMTDRTNTVASWVEVTRGRIEINPGETVTVPLLFRIHPFAEPGEYHVFVGFVAVAKRYMAENAAKSGDAKGVIVKLTIDDGRKETMRIKRFVIDRFITSDEDREINLEVVNSGDLSSIPVGEIVFYNSHGEEVSAVSVNEDGAAIAPGETVILKSRVPIGADLGKFKANVALQYGENQAASLSDTTFFYMMPLHIMLILFAAVLFVAIAIVLLFKRAFINDNVIEGDGEVAMYVKDGHDPVPKDHDIDLTSKNS